MMKNNGTLRLGHIVRLGAALASALLILLQTGEAAAQEPDASGDTEEELVEFDDFEKEERASDAEKQRIMAAAGAGSGGGLGAGLKLFVDMLVDHRIGEEKFQFRPNHFYAFVQATIDDRAQIMMHLSADPVFFELGINLLPKLTLTLGKLLVPFGSNEFHHIIGGRVDENSSFLPETWSDYGLSLRHQVYDGETVNIEYVAYMLNGFSGSDQPVFAPGSTADNNWWKGLGLRTRIGLFNKVNLVGSLYGDVWDEQGNFPLVFYAVGAELPRGLVDLPVLRRLRLRGEWSRGEVRLPQDNYQMGVMSHAYARSGYFFEAQWAATESVAVRLRTGRVNPDNRVTDDGDVEVYEPAVLVGTGQKLWWTVAYQLTSKPGFDLSNPGPADVVYAKFFLQF